MAFVEFKNLHTWFYTDSGIVKAVNGVDFEINEGETVCVVGESGCGKSVTALSMMHLVQTPPGKIVDGQILMDGVDLLKMDKRQMEKINGKDIAMIFQEPMTSLNPVLTVGHQIMESLLFHTDIDKKSARAKALEMLKLVGIPRAEEILDCYPHELSGGQRQRIGIARALVLDPQFVICDEPVSALDVSIQSQIINLLLDLKEQNHLTYLFISHDLSVIKYISDRIGVMYLGNMMELADTEHLFAHPYHPYTEALLSAIPTTDVDGKKDTIILEGDIPSPINPPKGCKFHTRCRYCTEICENVTPEFEEVEPGHFVACHHKLGAADNK